jgi:4-diphosphocytidyl-2-C-methyl-D-erythritol kinase
MPDCYILLVKPEISVSTKHVYENLKLDNNTRHPDIPAMLNALKENDIYRLTSLMENILESVTIKEYAVIGDIKENMMDKKALTALMSGSGPTVFGIFDDQNKAENAYRYFKSSGYGKQVVLTKPYFPNSANR